MREGQSMAASQKLSHLLQLADQGPALRAALAEEVAELLASWPSDYPENMRAVCEALLAKARESNLQPLIAAARSGENLVAPLAQCLGMTGAMAQKILDNKNGAMLVVACKGAGFDRAAFSALALLIYPAHDRSCAFAMLDAFDAITVNDASHTLKEWQTSQAA
jgi:hypothetical protein